MIQLNVAIVSNEWFMTYNEQTKEVIVQPTYVDGNTSAVISDNIKIEVAENEQILLDIISELNLIMPENDI